MGNIRHEYQSQNHLIKPSISGCSKFRRGVVKNTRGVVNFDWGVVMYQNRSPNTYKKHRFDTISIGPFFALVRAFSHMVEHILMWRTVKNEDKNREQFRCLHDLLDFYTITSLFTRFE